MRGDSANLPTQPAGCGGIARLSTQWTGRERKVDAGCAGHREETSEGTTKMRNANERSKGKEEVLSLPLPFPSTFRLRFKNALFAFIPLLTKMRKI